MRTDESYYSTAICLQIVRRVKYKAIPCYDEGQKR